MNQSIQNNSIIEEKDSPRGPSISPNNSALRLRKKKELMFINKEDKIKAAITKCFGGLD